jgi:hypothetical protein
MNKLFIIIEALQKGKSLGNPETWKTAGALTGIFAVILKAIEILLPDLQIDGVDRASIINGLTSIALVFGSYLHIATSKSVGLK